MHVGRNRIFVGNLPPSISESEIKEQFQQYGNVVSVEIKHRKESVNENVSPVFAFVSIETDKNQLHECFQSIPNYNWNGYYVKLELAKESFLERLKREREEAQNKLTNNTNTPVKQEINLPPSTLITTSNSKKKVYSSGSSSSSSSDSSSSDDDDDVKITKIQNLSNIKENSDKPPKKTDADVQDIVIKNNKNKQLTNGKLTIESVNSTPIHVITKKSNGLQKDGQKLTPADEKRLNSLYKLKESYDQQKNLIKNALSQIDSKTSNKIVFDDNGKQHTNQKNKRKQNFDDGNNEGNNSKKEKVALFEEDEDDDNINFEIKNQFEGKKGQRLLELQSRFTNDKRFTLDSRFVDDENEDKDINDEHNDDDDNEKQKQLEILETVIGKKINKMPEQDQNKKNMPRGMFRYDPTNVEHSKFEIKDKPNNNNNINDDDLETTTVEKKVEEAPVEVSEEKFYKVTDNLKQAFKENKESQGFSLLSMFGRTEDKKEADNHETATELIKSKYDTTRNPFRYDSSDDDDENIKQKHVEVKKIKPNFSRPISGEKFFFQNEDERLKDGLNFLMKFGGNNEESAQKFMDTRREIKQIIRAKIRNVQRNNRPFRKKIGQHKHIQIKKAKKN